MSVVVALAGVAVTVAHALASRDILVRHFRSHGLGDALRITVGTDAEIDAFLVALRDIVSARAI